MIEIIEDPKMRNESPYISDHETFVVVDKIQDLVIAYYKRVGTDEKTYWYIVISPTGDIKTRRFLQGETIYEIFGVERFCIKDVKTINVDVICTFGRPEK